MTPADLARRVRAHEPWACPDCLPDISVAIGADDGVAVTVVHSAGCAAVAYWLLVAEPGRPPGAGPLNPHDPLTEEDLS